MDFLDCQKERIYITGFMGTGKTTAGKELSRMLNYGFIDTDSLIEKDTGMSIDEIFAAHDEPYFRQLERKVLLSTFNLKKAVIATGGGLPIFEDNMKLIKNNGISVSLIASPDIILSRISNDTNIRPLLKGDKKEEKFNLLIHKRIYYYIQAHILVDTSNITAKEVAEIISNKAGY